MTGKTSEFDWNDLRFLLAVSEEGSTLAAARKLKVDQTTVARRIAALERALGEVLMERRQSGYVPTEDGQVALAFARRMRTIADELAAHKAQSRRTVSGTIRLTLTEAVANHLVTPILPGFYEKYPDVRVELVVDDRRFDLLKGEADVAIRAGAIPDEPGLVVRRLYESAWSLYCSRDYAATRGLPASPAELNDHAVVLCDPLIARIPAMAWLKEIAPRATVGSTSSSLTNVKVAIEAGLGIGALPDTLGDHMPKLVCCYREIPGSRYDFFILLRESMRRLPRVRALCDYLVAQLGKARPSAPSA